MDYLENLICVLLHGPSGAGKSETAKLIAAPNGVRSETISSSHKIFWDYRVLAAPLNEMHTIKTNVVGADLEDRQLWLLHDVFVNLFPIGSVNFADFIELIYDTQAYPLQLLEDVHGHHIKDRDFMTFTADACHKLYPNIFATYLSKSIIQNYKAIERSQAEDDLLFKNIVVVADLRLVPELETFKDLNCKLITIKLNVSDEEQDIRLLNRDNRVLSESQRKHETQISPFTNQDFDLVLQTDDYDLASQVLNIKDYIIGQITN